MTNNDAAKLYEAKLQNPNLNIEEIIKAVCKTRNDPEGYAQNLISEYYKIIKDAELHGHSGMDIVKYLKGTKDEIFVANLDKEGNIEIAAEYEKQLPGNLYKDKDNVDFPDAEVNTGEAKEPPKDNIAFEDEDKYDLSVDDGTKDNVNFPDAQVNTGNAEEPPKDNVAFEDEDKYDVSVDNGTEDNINFPDAQVNTGNAEEPPKDDVYFKDSPINDTETGKFRLGDESTEGALYLNEKDEKGIVIGDGPNEESNNVGINMDQLDVLVRRALEQAKNNNNDSQEDIPPLEDFNMSFGNVSTTNGENNKPIERPNITEYVEEASKPTDDSKIVFMDMMQGNPGAISVVTKMVPDSEGIKGLTTCESLNIKGAKLWMLYSDCCDQNIYKMYRTLEMFRAGVFTEKQIQDNLSLMMAIPFIDDHIKVDGVPEYGSGEYFGQTSPQWDEYCYKNKELFTKRLNTALDQGNGPKGLK